MLSLVSSFAKGKEDDYIPKGPKIQITFSAPFFETLIKDVTSGLLRFERFLLCDVLTLMVIILLFYLRERYFGRPNTFRNIAHRRRPQPESVHHPSNATRNRRNVSHLPTDAMRNRRNVSHGNNSNSVQHTGTFHRSSTVPDRLPPRAQNPLIRTQLDDANLERTVRLLLNNDFARRSLQAERWEERWLDIHNDIRRLTRLQANSHVPESLPSRSPILSPSNVTVVPDAQNDSAQPTNADDTAQPANIHHRRRRMPAAAYALGLCCFFCILAPASATLKSAREASSGLPIGHAPQWDESDGYAYFRIFFRMLTGF